MDELLGRVAFENIPIFGEPPKPKPPQPASRGLGLRGGFEQLESFSFAPATRSIEPVSHPRGGTARGAESYGDDAPREIVFEDSDLEILPLDAADLVEVKSLGVEEKKPSEVSVLENILSLAYSSPIEITAINELPTSRKQVKEVHFFKTNHEWLYKVWVFKADPVSTAKELAVYYIADQRGIPTGKPIGYKPSEDQKQYPFDIAILGGAMVEHAGDPYNKLLQNMRFAPERVHEVAKSVAGLIAKCHVKLTAAKDDFERYGVSLEKADPGKEIKERLLAALGIDNADALIGACRDLYNKQSDLVVVSHGDIHTGNVVTRERGYATHISEFGIIDWGSVMFDNPYSDLRDFWLHHQRQALRACGRYDFGFDSLNSSYIGQFLFDVKREGIEATLELSNCKRDSLIQSALWNLYEMYDPVRKGPREIEEKAAAHCQALMSDLDQLQMWGVGREANAVKKELGILLKDKPYLKPVL